jgi:hypothetical protein
LGALEAYPSSGTHDWIFGVDEMISPNFQTLSVLFGAVSESAAVLGLYEIQVSPEPPVQFAFEVQVTVETEQYWTSMPLI